MKQFKVQITAFESLLDENLEELKGGTAEVYATEEDKKKAGDGASWFCCINIKIGGSTEKEVPK